MKAKSATSRPPMTEVVGIELGSSSDTTTPIVRVRRRADGVIELVAAELVAFDSTLPVSPDKIPEGVSLILPKHFHVNAAALALSSESAVLRQAAGVDDALSDKDKSLYRTMVFSQEGEALSFVAAIPEYMAAWAAQLLPEGRKPTAYSIQISNLARINAFTVSVEFQKTNGSALLLLVDRRTTALVIFCNFKPLLYREHSIGSEDVIDAVCRDMNLDRPTVENILNDTLIDPTAVLEPVLAPLFRQAELSTDYAIRKNNCFIDKFFLCGLTAGSHYWADIFKRKTGGEIIPCNPLDNFPTAPGAQLPPDFDTCSGRFIPAIGAAVAVLEDA